VGFAHHHSQQPADMTECLILMACGLAHETLWLRPVSAGGTLKDEVVGGWWANQFDYDRNRAMKVLGVAGAALVIGMIIGYFVGNLPALELARQAEMNAIRASEESQMARDEAVRALHETQAAREEAHKLAQLERHRTEAAMQLAEEAKQHAEEAEQRALEEKDKAEQARQQEALAKQEALDALAAEQEAREAERSEAEETIQKLKDGK
jgi:uncharacterized membrane-anchored protein YhcB (DUF1043 family)